MNSLIENIKFHIEQAYDRRENKIITKDFFSEIKPSINNILQAIDKFSPLGYSEKLFDELFEKAQKHYETLYPIELEESISLKRDYTTWLTEEEKNKIGWNANYLIDPATTYLDRYLKYLKKLDRAPKVIDETRNSILKIIESMKNPTTNTPFYTKGLVIGSVQSGKTANFNGVINAAFDSGYELVIVLSGLMNDLRVQTQKRLYKDVKGKDKNGNDVGVGRIDAANFIDKNISCITSDETDFNENQRRGGGDISSGKNILVVKKNVSILRNILFWLNDVKGNRKTIDTPLLIIDDEADNASLDNHAYLNKLESTTTNSFIRSILNLFSRKTYLGYTATPFANIFQARYNEKGASFKFEYKEESYNFGMVDNLFPDDFIKLLNPPTNYVGLKYFFDTYEGERSRKKIDQLTAQPIDFIDKDYFKKIPQRIDKTTNEPCPSSVDTKQSRAVKKTDPYPTELPQSLKDAILCFIISIAIRDSRKEAMEAAKFSNKHHTMLINIERFTDWQNTLKEKVVHFVNELTRDLYNTLPGEGIYTEFRRIWNAHFLTFISDHQEILPSNYLDEYLIPKDFDEDIISRLPSSVIGIEIKAVNSTTGDNLIYGDKAKKYIAIGGNRLSRGFTLEGLTINYFLRKVKTADTLMQMGRWFGYRPGFIDCCKLFTTSDNLEKFNSVSLITQDLENKLVSLAKQPNRTPADFTIWVRNNPDVIKLTRSNFLKNIKKYNLNFEDSLKQSTHYKLTKSNIQKFNSNFLKHIKSLAFSASPYNKDSSSKKKYFIHETDISGLKKFINIEGIENLMTNWNRTEINHFLDKCKEQEKLNNWKIALVCSTSKQKGSTNISLDIKDKNNQPLIDNFKTVVRSGPKKEHIANYSFLKNNAKFKIRNSNLITPNDFKICISPLEYDELKKTKKSLSERDFRAQMDLNNGVLLIYFMSLPAIFSPLDEENPDPTIIRQLDFNQNFIEETPLIGYALGFPKKIEIEGSEYVSQNTYNFNDEILDFDRQELIEYIDEYEYDIDYNSILDIEKIRKAIINIESKLKLKED